MKCVMCGAQEENLEHFMLECPPMSPERKKSLILQKPHQEKSEDVKGNFLFNEEMMERSREVLESMWQKRGLTMKRMEERQLNEQ